MHYSLLDTLQIHAGDCLVLGMFANQSLPNQVADLDKKLNGLIACLSRTLLESGDMVWQADADGRSLLIIHCGDEALFTIDALNNRIADLTQALIKQKKTRACIFMPNVAAESADKQLQHMLLAFDYQLYQFLDFKTGPKKTHALETLSFFLPGACKKVLDYADSVAEGIRFTRNLANLPANVCTPTYLAEQAQQLAQEHATIKTRVMDKAAIQKLGMGAFLSVAQGSVQPPQFIEIQYQGASQKAPVVLVGKGVTFDSGGISLKPPANMEEMKYDMGGAASVLGTIKACALLQLPIHVIGLIPTTENMPSGSATKPGDIVTSMSGQTIEITNTDAEGRLILADALTYAEHFNPEFVIDIATLTGAIVIALGHEITGLFTSDDALAEQILSAARESHDKTWRLPIHEAYQEAINSPIADIMNSTGDRAAGSITAACFLSRFTKQYRWAHLDIAGAAWISGSKRNATGRPVPLLLQILNNAC
jgi:leucyl aminopeptidase